MLIHTPCPAPTPFYKASIHYLSLPSTVCNNNTMHIDVLLEMTQCDKCGSARNDDIVKLYVGSGAGP